MLIYTVITHILNITMYICTLYHLTILLCIYSTSQPSLNAFVACTEGAAYDTGIDYLTLEVYDNYWARVRAMYAPFESGVYTHTYDTTMLSTYCVWYSIACLSCLTCITYTPLYTHSCTQAC